ncbi:MAG: hypothetical protein A4E19_03315 [Nitrospira sp. SG-bin1]|nr:MAG: hypothetical protein A4E19_03315 [Nitrospira sp. SG-bin1]
MRKLSSLSIDGLRLCVGPEYADESEEDLESIIDTSISDLPSSTAENFLRGLQSLAKAVSPTLQRAAPSIAQGAATGAMAGGPWGAAIGAGLGLASSALRGRGMTQPSPGPAVARSVPPPATGAPATLTPPALPTGKGAAATFLSLIQNPTVQQALLSQVLGSAGAQQASTASGMSVPRGAINSLLTQLLANASEALPELESISDQRYLQGKDGEYLIDPASPEQQAALVLSHIQRIRPMRSQADPGDFVDMVEWSIEDFVGAGSVWPEFDETSETVQFY